MVLVMGILPLMIGKGKTKEEERKEKALKKRCYKDKGAC